MPIETKAAEEKQVRTRDLGQIMVQEFSGELVGGGAWTDRATRGEDQPFEAIRDASDWIVDNGTAGSTYRIVRVYPPVKVVETRARKLEPA